MMMFLNRFRDVWFYFFDMFQTLKLPSGRLNIDGWNIAIFNRKYIFNQGPAIPASYLRLPEGTSLESHKHVSLQWYGRGWSSTQL